MTLRDALGTRAFALTAELIPVPDTAELVRVAQALAGCVDAVQVPDNPGGRAHLPALVAAAALKQAGIDPVLQISGRDRNRTALQSELLGAASLGIRNLLLIRGKRPPAGPAGSARVVFEVQVRELIATARALAEGEAPFGQKPPAPPDFFIGSMATVFDPAQAWKPQSLTAKLDAGAQFVQTQHCLDVVVMRRYVKRLVAAQLMRRAHLLVTVPVLLSADDARRLRDGARGALIPDAVIRRLAQAADPVQAGVQIAAEVLQAYAEIPGMSGAALTSSGAAGIVRAAVDLSGLRPPEAARGAG